MFKNKNSKVRFPLAPIYLRAETQHYFELICQSEVLIFREKSVFFSFQSVKTTNQISQKFVRINQIPGDPKLNSLTTWPRIHKEDLYTRKASLFLRQIRDVKIKMLGDLFAQWILNQIRHHQLATLQPDRRIRISYGEFRYLVHHFRNLFGGQFSHQNGFKKWQSSCLKEEKCIGVKKIIQGMFGGQGYKNIQDIQCLQKQGPNK